MNYRNRILLAVILPLWNFPSPNCTNINKVTKHQVSRPGSAYRHVVLCSLHWFSCTRRHKNSTHTERVSLWCTVDRKSHNSINSVACKYSYMEFYHLLGQSTHNNVIFTVWTVCYKFSSGWITKQTHTDYLIMSGNDISVISV